MNKVKIMIVLFLSVLTLSSCQQKAQSPPVQLYLSFIDEMPQAYVDKLLAAINAINTEAGVEIVALRPISNGKPLSIMSMRRDSIFAHAQYLDYFCKIEVDESKSTTNNSDPEQLDIKYILLHEIGHCYGYQHTTDSTNIMFPDYVGYYPCSSSPAQCAVTLQVTKNKISSFLQELKLLL
jgi:hypothetical protein